MDHTLFEDIMRATKATAGAEIFESRTGNSVASVKIAKDWLAALRDIIADKADAVKVIAEFEKRIDAEVAKGDYSNIYSHIRQQMPDTMDLGAIAANLEGMEKLLKQVSSNAVNEAKDTGASLTTATQSPSKVNSKIDVPDIKKNPVKVTNPDSLDTTNSNEHGTQGDEIIEGYYLDDEGDIFYVYEDGNAFYVDEEGEPVEEAFCGNVHEDDIYGEKLELSEDGEEDFVAPYVLFEDADGDTVYFNEDGDLFYATEENMQDGVTEDVNIYYNSDGQGGVNVDQGNEGMPPQEDPNAQAQAQADAQSPQEPMQVELIKGGQSGEVDGVVVDVAGKHIEIGPDGTVNEQPLGGNAAPKPPQQPPQAVQESKMALITANLLKFFGEDNHDYTDVKHRKPKTATGGDFPISEPVDPKAVDALNSGGDIDGHKVIKEETVEAGELFEEEGKWYYYNDNGELFEASEQDVQGAEARPPKDYDDVTIPAGLGKSITSVNEDKPADTPVTGGMVYESLSDYDGFVRAVKGRPEVWQPAKD